jgi:hypothetical protein
MDQALTSFERRLSIQSKTLKLGSPRLTNFECTRHTLTSFEETNIGKHMQVQQTATWGGHPCGDKRRSKGSKLPFPGLVVGGAFAQGTSTRTPMSLRKSASYRELLQFCDVAITETDHCITNSGHVFGDGCPIM